VVRTWLLVAGLATPYCEMFIISVSMGS
jgi:hypothetical protein